MIERFVSSQALILLFLFFALTIAVIIKQIRKNCSYVPYTPTLFMISVLLGYFADDIGIIGQSIKSMSLIDPRGILIIFLPPLIFESAFSSDLYTFKKQSTQIFILAFPSVLCSALILMLSLKLIIGYDDTYYTWAQAFMFGSILSCTDTVAVLALLKQAGAPKKFNSLIQGQSLFNDGTCMVLFIISLQLVKGSTPHILEIILLFFELTVGAIILGIIFGFLSTSLIKIVYNDDILVLNTTVVFCYLLYFIAQYVDFGIRISGIMALVSMGLYMAAFGKTKFTPQARQTVNRFWKIFVFIAETIIFILGGVLVGVKALDKNNVITIIGSTDIINVIILYFSMFLARGLSITIFMPKLQKEGYGLKWNQVIALTYGGIRGAVGIAFTLILASNVNLPDKLKKVCLFNMAGCSFLTLLINASTMSFLIKKIGLSIKSDIKVKLFTKFMKQFENNLQLRLHEMQKDKHLQNSDWQQVQHQSGLKQLQNMIQINLHKNNKKQINMHHGINQYLIGDQIINQNFDTKLMSEIRNCFCVALKGICWQKFQNNQCSCESIKNLIECIDLDLDTIDQALNSWQFLLNHIHNPIYFPILFWLRQFHFLKNFANSQIFYHTQILYDVISTYIECMKQCQIACKQFPFDEQYLNEINKQCNKNCNYAKNYLKDEIQIVFPDIMKKIQIDKAAQSILSFQKQILNDTYNHGQIDQLFFKQLKQNIQIYIKKIQNDNGIQQILTDQQILKKNIFFLYMSSKNLKYLLSEKIEITIQKDQPLIKNYQKQKFLYFIIRGAMIEEWKQNNKSIYFRNISIHQIAGQSTLILNNYKQLSMYINATSIVCLYCFPLSIIKQILLNQPQLECYFWIDLLPLVINLIPLINLKFTSFDFFMKIKSEIKFIQLKEQQYQLINNKFIIVIEGSVEIKNIEYKQGYYQSNQNNIKIIGPGKFYISSYKLTQEINKDRKSINSDIRTSVKKRKSLRSNSGSIFKKTLFTKD